MRKGWEYRCEAFPAILRTVAHGLAVEDAGDEEEEAAHQERHADAGLQDLRVAVGALVDLAGIVDRPHQPKQRAGDQHVLRRRSFLLLHASEYFMNLFRNWIFGDLLAWIRRNRIPRKVTAEAAVRSRGTASSTRPSWRS